MKRRRTKVGVPRFVPLAAGWAAAPKHRNPPHTATSYWVEGDTPANIYGE